MNNRIKPLVIITTIVLGSFYTPTTIYLANAVTSTDLSQLEEVVDFVEGLTDDGTSEIKEVAETISLTDTSKSSEVKEVELTTEDVVNQTESIFNIGDWRVTETSRHILLTGYKGSSKMIYIPGEYNQKQVVLNDFSILPDDLVSIQLKEVNGKKVKLQTTSLYQALANQKKLVTINLSGLDTSTVVNMKEMFANSTSIETLNLTGWKTSKVQNMSGMFKGVKQLKSLDINHFDTGKVLDFSQMFYGMESLEFLDISSLKTTSATTLYQIFGNMFDLNAVDLSAFTSKTSTNLKGMFYCSGSEKCNTPLLAIVDDVNIESAYTKSTPKRYLGANMTLFSYENYRQYTRPFFGFFLPFTEEDLESLVLVTQFFIPAKREDYILSGWELNKTFSNQLERWYYQLNGPYVAKWSPVSYSVLTTSSTAISGKGMPEGRVEASVDGTSIGSTFVNQNGNYQLKIPKQKRGTEVTVTMYGETIEPVRKTLTVLGELTTFTNTQLTQNSTTISGKGVVGAKVTAYVDGKSIGTTTVDSKGNYSIKIAKQKAGKEITIKMTKSGYASKSEKTKVLNAFSTLKVNAVTKNTTTIKGTGTKDAKVTAYVDGKSIGTTTVDSKGNYSIKIAKQKAGKEIIIKMTKSGYASKSEKIKVLNAFSTLKVNAVTKNTTTIKGTGTKDAKVTAYVDGKSIGTTTVDSKGNYSIKIAKQKAGKEITIKMTKSGYASKSEKIKVLNAFSTLKVNAITKNTTTIKGTGTKDAKVTAYVDGKSIGTATVDSKGNYSIKIPKQKAGKEIIIKMTKSGYATLSKTVSVTKG